MQPAGFDYSFLTGLHNVPMRSMMVSITSPPFKKGTPENAATPAGVPVEIKSPGNSVSPADRYSINSATENTMSSVLAFCLSTPLTFSEIESFCGSGISSGVTSQGPNGNAESSAFPFIQFCPNGFVFSGHPSGN